MLIKIQAGEVNIGEFFRWQGCLHRRVTVNKESVGYSGGVSHIFAFKAGEADVIRLGEHAIVDVGCVRLNVPPPYRDLLTEGESNVS